MEWNKESRRDLEEVEEELPELWAVAGLWTPEPELRFANVYLIHVSPSVYFMGLFMPLEVQTHLIKACEIVWHC